MTRLQWTAMLTGAVLSTTTPAATTFDEIAALQSLTGHWRGEQVEGQGPQAIRRQVHLQLKVDELNGRVMETLELPGQGLQQPRAHLLLPDGPEAFTFVQLNSALGWYLVWEQQVVIDHRPATLRTSLKRQGPQYQQQLEVDFLDDRQNYWTRLRYGSYTRLADPQLASND